MGFFSDLKDDLSQAVNEMLPEEEATQVTDGADSLPDVDLSAMLDQVDAAETIAAEDSGIIEEIPDIPEMPIVERRAEFNRMVIISLSSIRLWILRVLPKPS